jgi:hypothetical protein
MLFVVVFQMINVLPAILWLSVELFCSYILLIEFCESIWEMIGQVEGLLQNSVMEECIDGLNGEATNEYQQKSLRDVRCAFI